MAIWYDTLSDSAIQDESVGTSSGPFARGEGVENSGSTMIGEVVGTVIVSLKKVGSPTGLITCIVQNDAATVTTTISTLDATTLTTSFANYTFATLSPHTIVDNENVRVSFTGDDSNYIMIQNVAKSLSTDSGKAYKTTTWSQDTNKDWKASINSTGGTPPPGGSGTRLPPPPIVLGGF